MTTDFSIQLSMPIASGVQARTNRRRRITPQAGHALETLGHAIEYLTDEFVHRGGNMSSSNGELEAVQLLMAFAHRTAPWRVSLRGCRKSPGLQCFNVYVLTTTS
jgi:hypothetical protein